MAQADELAAAVAAAAGRVRNVRTVPSVRMGRQEGSGRLLVGVRVGLPPLLALADVVQVVARVQLAAARALPEPANVYVEPDVAADQATPTETIVIRALE